MFRSHNSDFMFVANVTYYFEIFSWNLKKMRGEIYLDTDYINILTSLKIEISMFGVIHV